MHEKLSSFLLSSLISLSLYSQAPDEIDRLKTITLVNTDGKPFVNKDFDVEGTPFYFEKWKFGTIKMISNNVYNNIQVRLNLQSHEVHFLTQNNIEMTVLPELVKELFIYDTSGSTVEIYDFQCGFPATDNQTAKDFYRVLSNGKVKLVESIKREIRQRKNDSSGEIKKEYVSYENYYVYRNNALQAIRLNKNSVLAAFSDQQARIEDFVKTSNLSYRSGTDLKKIADYYNSL